MNEKLKTLLQSKLVWANLISLGIYLLQVGTEMKLPVDLQITLLTLANSIVLVLTGSELRKIKGMK